jgi:hypothetical protein
MIHSNLYYLLYLLAAFCYKFQIICFKNTTNFKLSALKIHSHICETEIDSYITSNCFMSIWNSGIVNTTCVNKNNSCTCCHIWAHYKTFGLVQCEFLLFTGYIPCIIYLFFTLLKTCKQYEFILDQTARFIMRYNLLMTSWKVETCCKQVKTNVTTHATIDFIYIGCVDRTTIPDCKHTTGYKT